MVSFTHAELRCLHDDGEYRRRWRNLTEGIPESEVKKWLKYGAWICRECDKHVCVPASIPLWNIVGMLCGVWANLE
jgi:hypothetical protein